MLTGVAIRRAMSHQTGTRTEASVCCSAVGAALALEVQVAKVVQQVLAPAVALEA